MPTVYGAMASLCRRLVGAPCTASIPSGRVEYLERRRTLPAIAAEVGTTAPNIARIAHQHGIELRKRGGPVTPPA